MTVELLDIKNDFVFKQVFGTEENKDVLISFINAVIKKPIIKDITLTNSEISKYKADNKSVRLDIKAKTNDGVLIDVEIQCRNTGELVDRALYYAMAMIVENTKSSYYKKFEGVVDEVKDILMEEDLLKSKYKYPKAICIWILNTDIFPHRKDYREVISFQLEDSRYDGKELASDKVKLYMLSLPKFNPQIEMEKAHKDLLTKWMTFLKRPENGEVLENKEIKKSYKALEILSRTPEAQEYYEGVEKWQSVRENEIIFAKNEGLAEGEKKGEHNAKIETAKNFLKMGLSIEQVAQGTGLTIEEIKKL